jgi:hypothetical protein
MKLSKLFKEFLESEKTAGLILILCTIVSLALTNFFGHSYSGFWHTTIFSKPVEFWINDGLMTIFFLLVGLEIEREIYKGELSDSRRAMLPVLGAVGGMLVPAIIHFAFNHGKLSQNGFGIPMATDIAFSLAILSLLGNRVPVSLKIFLTALAIIDDRGGHPCYCTILFKNDFTDVSRPCFPAFLRHAPAGPVEGLQNLDLFDPRDCNVVPGVSFRYPSDNYRRLSGFCHSLW